MKKAKEISALWSEIKPQIGELVRLCHEVESHYEVTADAYQRGYEAGLTDAWECAGKIVLDKEDGGLDTVAYSEIFGYEKGVGTVLKTFIASEAIEKIRAYEQEKDEIKVGDEVIYDGERCVVIFPQTEHLHATVIDCGRFHHSYVVDYDELKKTGRHFSELVEVMKKMKENSDG